MTPEKRQSLEWALNSGITYILSRQEDDGSWVDWQLPPGESRAWTTAFVGCKLVSLQQCLCRNIAPLIRRAAEWLLHNISDDKGWGYNSLVGSDADSTAHAILLLSQCAEPVPDESYRHLQQFQRPDGGFSTYLPQNGPSSWTVSHPDVTPIALLALLTKYSYHEAFIERGLAYVLRQRTAAGLWNSFWWESFIYSTEANLSLVSTSSCIQEMADTRGSLTRFMPEKPFEIALQLSALLSLNDTAPEANIGWLIDQSSHQLVTKQHADGSWKNESILRVTNRDCYEPWSYRESGALFSDPNRLFTSTTVVAALSKVLSRL
jgi:squalene cyclase